MNKIILFVIVIIISLIFVNGEITSISSTLSSTLSSSASTTYPNCEPCLNYIDIEEIEIRKIIIGGENIESCNSLCSQIKNETMVEPCNFLCNNVGVKDFISINTDQYGQGEFYICEQLGVCLSYPKSRAKISYARVEPLIAPQGTNFTLKVGLKVPLFSKLGLSSLEAIVSSCTFCSLDIYSQLIIYESYGNYDITFNYPTTNDPEWYPVGEYQAQFSLCENGCGQSHSKFLDIVLVKFNITQQQ